MFRKKEVREICPVKKSLIFRALYLVLGGLVLNLSYAPCVCADDQIAQVLQDVRVSQNRVQEYEQVGDYAKALKAARDGYKDSIKSGLGREAADFSQSIKRLEAELLVLGSSRLLFDESWQPRVKLLQLLELLGMKPVNRCKTNLLEINRWAQENLLRKGERWEEQANRFEVSQSKMISLLSDLGFVDASLPHFNEYEGALVHGARLGIMRLRIHYLIEQWERGVRFAHLFFLSGERPLEPQQENEESFMQDKDSPLKIRKDWLRPVEFPKTECEMIRLIWEQSEIPESLRKKVQVYFINAPVKKDPLSGKLLRPNTNDTVECWIKTEPPHGRYLAITNAPYVNRQDLVVRTIAPSGYGFDTIGFGASKQEKVAILLDELARFIFQMQFYF